MSTQTGGGWDSAVQTQDLTPGTPTPGDGGGKRGLNSILVDQSETIVSTIGNGYLQNFLMGGQVRTGFGFLTQKRFYFKGKNFGCGEDKRKGFFRSFTSTNEEGVVSMEDITFTRFTYTRPLGLLILAILLTIGTFISTGAMTATGNGDLAVTVTGMLVPVALLFYILYFICRQTIFEVFFAGGSFGFDIRYYPIADMRDFQRQLHLLKDDRKEGMAA